MSMISVFFRSPRHLTPFLNLKKCEPKIHIFLVFLFFCQGSFFSFSTVADVHDCLASEQLEHFGPEFFPDAAVDEEVDGGVTDEEEVVEVVQDVQCHGDMVSGSNNK